MVNTGGVGGWSGGGDNVGEVGGNNSGDMEMNGCESNNQMDHQKPTTNHIDQSTDDDCNDTTKSMIIDRNSGSITPKKGASKRP